ncbi:hypothetical protein [Mycolicibacterium llatzerense]|nr:hypothetical protein [Mycolicibacterium llatzerense]
MVINRVGLGLAVLGAAAVMTAAALVRLQSGGWILITSSVGIAGSALWVSRGNHRAAVLPVAVCVLSSVPILVGAALSSAIGPGLSLLPHAIAAIGVAVALVGSLLLARRPVDADDQSSSTPIVSGYGAVPTTNDNCPRCKRWVKAGVKTCGYCGFAVKRYRAV